MKILLFFFHAILFSFSSLGLKPAVSWKINLNDNSDKKFLVGKFNFFTEDGRLLVYFFFLLNDWLFYYLDHSDESNPIVLSNEELISALKKFQPIGKYLLLVFIYYIFGLKIFSFSKENNTICLQSELCIADWLKKYDHLYGKLAQRLTLLNVIFLNILIA